MPLQLTRRVAPAAAGAILLAVPPAPPTPPAPAPPVGAAYNAPAAEGYRGVWYQITGGGGRGPEPWNANKYGGAMATYPQQHAPIAVRRRDDAAGVDRTYFVYGGDGGGATTPNMVGYFDHKTGLLARPRVVLTRGKLDSHENPTLAVDDAGHLFVFSGGHGADRRAYITRSAEPWAIDRWVRLADLSGGDAAETFSYAQPHHVPGRGFLLLHTHYRGGGNRTLYANRSADGVAWDFGWALDGPNPRPKLAAIEAGQYQVSWRFGDVVATAFNVHPSDAAGNPLDHRTNLYYAETPDLGRTWRTAGGVDLTDTLPLTGVDNPALVADYRSRGLNVYLKDVQRDGSGRPVVLFLTSRGPEPGPGNGPHTLRTARFDGAAWVVRDVLTTDHNYDHGSLLVEPTPAGERWRVVGPFLGDPAQPWATGGNVGEWASDDRGETWRDARRLTADRARNHSYVRRVLGGSPDFELLWSAGHAWVPGEVTLHFSDRGGRVYRMPDAFAPGEDFAAPVPVPLARPLEVPTR